MEEKDSRGTWPGGPDARPDLNPSDRPSGEDHTGGQKKGRKVFNMRQLGKPRLGNRAYPEARL